MSDDCSTCASFCFTAIEDDEASGRRQSGEERSQRKGKETQKKKREEKRRKEKKRKEKKRERESESESVIDCRLPIVDYRLSITLNVLSGAAYAERLEQQHQQRLDDIAVGFAARQRASD